MDFNYNKIIKTYKLKLSEYDAFYDDEVQQDSFECLLLLIAIMNKGFVPCSTDEHMATFGSNSLSERFISFVLEKYIVCDICRPRSPSFETTTVLYITPTNNASMEILVKLYMTY